jgi:hypothetical protein
MPGFHVERVLVANPDYETFGRIEALQDQYGAAQLVGIVGHDKGGPERSFTGPLTSIADATAESIASIGVRANAMPAKQAGDASPAFLIGDPVMQALYARSEER